MRDNRSDNTEEKKDFADILRVVGFCSWRNTFHKDFTTKETIGEAEQKEVCHFA